MTTAFFVVDFTSCRYLLRVFAGDGDFFLITTNFHGFGEIFIGIDFKVFAEEK